MPPLAVVGGGTLLPPPPWRLLLHSVCFSFSFRFEIKVSESFSASSLPHTSVSPHLLDPHVSSAPSQPSTLLPFLPQPSPNRYQKTRDVFTFTCTLLSASVRLATLQQVSSRYLMSVCLDEPRHGRHQWKVEMQPRDSPSPRPLSPLGFSC